MTVAQRVRCLHKDEQDPEDQEGKEQAEDNLMRNQAFDPLDAMENRYPVEFTRPFTSQMRDWVMEYVQMQNRQGPTPAVCTSFCSIMKFWEQKHLKGYHVPLRVKNTI